MISFLTTERFMAAHVWFSRYTWCS